MSWHGGIKPIMSQMEKLVASGASTVEAHEMSESLNLP